LSWSPVHVAPIIDLNNMRATRLFGFVVGALLVAGAAPLWAQSLGDVAKKEEERRKQTPSSGKVYTNKDLGGAPPLTGTVSSAPVTPPPDANKPADATDKDAKGDAKSPADGKAAADKDAGVKKDQAYWGNRMKTAREALDRDSTLADAMQTRINTLTTDFVNRDDPAQRAVIGRDRQRALAELDRLKKQIVDDKKAIADLEEDARRAGIPPGWLR